MLGTLANVLYGMTNTHTMTLEQMISHSISKKKIRYSLLVVDMPKYILKCQRCKEKCQIDFKKNWCDAVKIESKKNYNIIKNLVSIKIPVMGHIGFTPQHKKNSKSREIFSQKKKLIKEAHKFKEQEHSQLY